MKYSGKILCLLASLLCMAVQAQDTVLHKIMSAKDDTLKVLKLADYAKKIGHQNSQQSKEIAFTLLKLSAQLKYDRGMGIGYSKVAYFENKEGRYTDCITTYNTAIYYYKKCNDKLGEAKCLGNLANAYESMGKHDSAILFRMASISILEKQQQSKEQLYLLSMQYYNVAITYDELFKEADKPLQYFKKAEVIAKLAHDTDMLASSLQGIAMQLRKKGRLDEALATTSEALKLSMALNDNLVLSEAYNTYSEILNDRNQINASIEAARLSMKYAELAGAEASYILAALTLAAPLKKTGDYKTLILVLEKARKKASRIEQVEHVHEIYEGLAEAHYVLGNYKLAFDYLSQRNIFKDSTYNETNNKVFAELEAKYQTSIKEQQLSQQQLKIAQKEVALTKSREVSLYSIGTTLVALFVATIIFLHYRNKRKLHSKQLQSLQQEKELQLLQALMQGEEKERSRIAKDLHDGVAGMLAAAKMQLSSLSIKNSSLAETKEYSQAVKLLDDSCHEVRMTSHNLMPEILMQYGLDEAINRFCNSISNKQLLQIQYAAYGTIGRFVLSFELTVYRIVQELLNNIVKHSKATVASVQLSMHDDFLSISIEDNGVGFDKNKSLPSGTGLNSLKQRIQAMNGTLEIDAQQEQGVTAFIGIDVANYKL